MKGSENSTTEDSNLTSNIVKGVFFFSIDAFIIVGNILVIVAIVRTPKLKSTTNILICSLAFTDLLLGLAVVPFSAVYSLRNQWDFGNYCNVFLSLDSAACTASILHLCMISLDRYIAITDPLRYSTKITKTVVFGMIFVTWIVSIFVSFIPVYAGWYKDSRHNDHYDDPHFCELAAHPEFALVSSSISFYIPCFIMVVAYGRIFVIARSQVSKINELERSIAKKAKYSYHKETKAFKTLGIILGVFILCWLPFFIVYIAQSFCACVPKMAFDVCFWFGYLNSSLNPIIYASNKDFR